MWEFGDSGDRWNNSLKAPLEREEREKRERRERLAEDRQIPEEQRESRSAEPGVHLFY